MFQTGLIFETNLIKNYSTTSLYPSLQLLNELVYYNPNNISWSGYQLISSRSFDDQFAKSISLITPIFMLHCPSRFPG